MFVKVFSYPNLLGFVGLNGLLCIDLYLDFDFLDFVFNFL